MVTLEGDPSVARAPPPANAGYNTSFWLSTSVCSEVPMVCPGQCIIPAPTRGRGRPRHFRSIKPPAGRFGLKVLFPEAEHNLRTHRKHRLLHREDVILHQ